MPIVQPMFRPGRPQFAEVVIQWVPTTPGENYIVELLGRGVYATCSDGVTVAAGDRALAQWVGRSLRIVQLVAKAPTAPTT